MPGHSYEKHITPRDISSLIAQINRILRVPVHIFHLLTYEVNDETANFVTRLLAQQVSLKIRSNRILSRITY